MLNAARITPKWALGVGAASMVITLFMAASILFDGGGAGVVRLPAFWSQPSHTEVFVDPFNQSFLDSGRWTTCYWWDNSGCTNQANHELEWYKPDNVQVKDGYLLLVAKPQNTTGPDGKFYPYTSGMVTTGATTSKGSPRFAFTYGFLQVRAWVPSGKGLWPAIWLLPADQSSTPEIDVMEMLGGQPDTVHMNFHYLEADGTEVTSEGKWSAGTDLTQGWHTFALDWEPNAITWFVDGTARRTFTDASKIPSQPMYLLMDLAVGGDWAGSPDAQTRFPAIFTIDSVQVWQASEQKP